MRKYSLQQFGIPILHLFQLAHLPEALHSFSEASYFVSGFLEMKFIKLLEIRFFFFPILFGSW
jgi:hypothetical protein